MERCLDYILHSSLFFRPSPEYCFKKYLSSHENTKHAVNRCHRHAKLNFLAILPEEPSRFQSCPTNQAGQNQTTSKTSKTRQRLRQVCNIWSALWCTEGQWLCVYLSAWKSPDSNIKSNSIWATSTITENQHINRVSVHVDERPKCMEKATLSKIPVYACTM